MVSYPLTVTCLVGVLSAARTSDLDISKQQLGTQPLNVLKLEKFPLRDTPFLLAGWLSGPVRMAGTCWST